MTPDQLAALGTKIHGPKWKTALARDLSLTYQTIRNYCAGKQAIPKTVKYAVKWLARKR